MIGNEVADLTQQREPTLRWLLFSAFCFHNRALWHGASQKPMLFSPETPSAYGMAVELFRQLRAIWILLVLQELVDPVHLFHRCSARPQSLVLCHNCPSFSGRRCPQRAAFQRSVFCFPLFAVKPQPVQTLNFFVSPDPAILLHCVAYECNAAGLQDQDLQRN